MLKLKITIILLFMFITTVFWSQERKYGDVTKADFEVNSPLIDAATKAIVLFRYKEVFFAYEGQWLVKTQVHERLKIISKTGLDYGTARVPLYKLGTDKEEIKNIKGQTFKLVEGKLVKQELEEGSVFDKNISENWQEALWALPNVEVGSIIEWTYETSSPFWKIDDLVFQDDIPVLHFQAIVRHPSSFEFSRLIKGGFDPKIQDSNKKVSMPISGNRKINMVVDESYRGTLSYIEMKQEYDMSDIAALKEEPYVTNRDNYRKTIIYELKTIKFPDSDPKNYSTSWEKVAETIYENDRFGEQLENTKFLQDALAAIELDGLSPKEKMKRAYAYVQNHYAWNGKYSKYVTQDLPKAFKEESGNVAEINLTLLALLQKLRVESYPILVSTVDNGIPKYPTLEGFNYVIVGVQLGEELVLLDATEKFSIPGLLPERVYNWEGRLVKSDGTCPVVDLFNKKMKPKTMFLFCELSEDASITGKFRTQYYELDALAYRKNAKGLSQEEKALEIANRNGIYEVTDVDIKDIENLDKPVTETYSFKIDVGADKIGNKIYISPLLFLTHRESPFKSETRDYPVDFIQPFEVMANVNMTLPEGYHVEYLPTGINLKMQDDLGSFFYTISVTENKLSLVTHFTIKTSQIETYDYQALKEFYDKRVAMENEKVILVKN